MAEKTGHPKVRAWVVTVCVDASSATEAERIVLNRLGPITEPLNWMGSATEGRKHGI